MREVMIDGRRLRLMRGDITRLASDAVVNAANNHLLPGGGVSGAIHSAGGPEIAREAARIGYCATGDAVATGAGNLPARRVIHAVAPIWRGGQAGEPELLAGAYRRSLEVADEIGARSVAFPSLGTGIYGYPVSQAAPVAMRTVIEHLSRPGTGLEEVIVVLFSDSDLAAYEQALAAVPSD